MRKLTKLYPVALIGCALGVSHAAEMRTFTSADGGKTLQAAVLEYTPDNGTTKIRRADGKVMTVPIKSLSKADHTYLEEWYQSTMAGRKISISIDDQEVKAGERKTDNAKIRTINSNFNINVRNNGDAAFEDLELKYRVFYYHDGARGKAKQSMTKDGTDSITRLIARGDHNIKTTAVQLTNVRPLPASQCKGGT